MATLIAGKGEFAKLPAHDKDALVTSLRMGEYNLFLGAGASLDSTNSMGECLPNGQNLKESLCQISGARPSSSLQRAFSGLTSEQVEQHVTARFIGCRPGPTVALVPSFVWRRIFTLNIDDVLERLYETTGSLQTLRSYHFNDTFEELRTLDRVPVIHLHGWSKQASKGYVFSRSEYARFMATPNAWMTVLADIMPVEPFIIAGTSLDEIDLEYYLVRRSATSPREDRGLSFFVEPNPDSQTENECMRYGLSLYHGSMGDFLQEISELVPNRQPPHHLVSEDTGSLLSADTDPKIILSFSDDFEKVPTTVTENTTAGFFYGHPPGWGDLAGGWDVGRSLAVDIRSMVDNMINDENMERIIVLSDSPGTGKSTVVRRVAYGLSKSGIIVLECTALSRLDPDRTAKALGLLDGPVVVLLDNFADQVRVVANILDMANKKDLIFLCAERNYRHRYVVSSLGDIAFKTVKGLRLSRAEAMQLVERYIKRGLVGSSRAINKRSRSAFVGGLVDEPIAVACCHILNDMRPLDSIVNSTYSTASIAERERYLVAALAQFCFKGGVRRSVLASAVSRQGWNAQFQIAHPLPLSYVDRVRRDFIVPLNATLAERTLRRAPKDDIAKAFRSLGSRIAARVNRRTIIQRSPEALLAGRLFDYEDVIRGFLNSKDVGQFYDEMRGVWQWNSRYWEQVALYNLQLFHEKQDDDYLREAIQHARHAVSVERHPFPLTTLARVLFAQLGRAGVMNMPVYNEAYENLVSAINMERRRSRVSMHAYVTLFSYTLKYLDMRYKLGHKQLRMLENLLEFSRRYDVRDPELRQISEELRQRLG